MPQALTDLPLEELLTYLANQRATGTLVVEVPHARKKVYLLDGLLAGVASTNPRELLGHFLVGWGLVSEEQVAEAMRLQEQLGTPLGRILERMGAIDSESLQGALVAQGEEAVLDLFLAPRLQTQPFAENIVPIDRPLVLRRPLPPLVLEGLRRRDRYREIRAVIPSDDVTLERLEGPPPATLHPRDRLILAAMDGRSSVEELALACHVVPFHVLELAFRGLQEGFVAVRPAGAPSPDASRTALVQRARTALEHGDLLAAWRAATTLQRHGATADAAAVLRELDQRLAPLRLQGPFVALVGRATPEIPPTLGAEGAFVLSWVNGRWSLREVQRITPLEELHFWVIVDALVKANALEIQPPVKGITLVTG